MASVPSDDVRYVKLILLLVKGGTFVAKKRVLKFSYDDQKCIDDYLKENEVDLNEAMNRKRITKKQMLILFPEPSTATDLAYWDISLISYVLLTVFGERLTEDEKVAVMTLRDTRNELAHSASTSLTEEHFLRKWTRLIMVLSNLKKQLPKADQDEYCDTVDKISSIKDLLDATNELQSFEGFDEMVPEIINEMKLQMEQRLNDCHHRIGELEASSVEMKSQLVIMTRIMVKALTTVEKDSAQTKLLDTLVEASHGQNPIDVGQSSEDDVLTACNNFVSDMRGQGVDIVTVEQGSILISVSCPAISALKNISKYFADRKYEERLRELENVLSKFVESPVTLHMNIVLRTLYSALAQIEKDAENRSLMLTLKCKGKEGVKSAFNFFGNGLHSLSDALSRYVGEPIELRSTIDVESLPNGITNAQERLSSVRNRLKYNNPTQTRHFDPELAETAASTGQLLFESELSEPSSEEFASGTASCRSLDLN